MAIEFEKIKPWDGQSGTGADNRGVIDRNFEKVKDELESIDTHVNTKFGDVEEEIVQLTGDLKEVNLIQSRHLYQKYDKSLNFYGFVSTETEVIPASSYSSVAFFVAIEDGTVMGIPNVKKGQIIKISGDTYYAEDFKTSSDVYIVEVNNTNLANAIRGIQPKAVNRNTIYFIQINGLMLRFMYDGENENMYNNRNNIIWLDVDRSEQTIQLQNHQISEEIYFNKFIKIRGEFFGDTPPIITIRQISINTYNPTFNIQIRAFGGVYNFYSTPKEEKGEGYSLETLEDRFTEYKYSSINSTVSISINWHKLLEKIVSFGDNINYTVTSKIWTKKTALSTYPFKAKKINNNHLRGIKDVFIKDRSLSKNYFLSACQITSSAYYQIVLSSSDSNEAEPHSQHSVLFTWNPLKTNFTDKQLRAPMIIGGDNYKLLIVLQDLIDEDVQFDYRYGGVINPLSSTDNFEFDFDDFHNESYFNKSDIELTGNVSQFENDANYITEMDLSGYAKKSDLPSLEGVATLSALDSKVFGANNIENGAVGVDKLSPEALQAVGVGQIDITNNPDNLTLEANNGLIGLKDRTFSDKTLGYKIISEDITLTQPILNSYVNSIVEVRASINIEGSSDLEFPENCTLYFTGGALVANNFTGKLYPNHTQIVAHPYHIFQGDLNIATYEWNDGSTFRAEFSYPEWFGAKGDGVSFDAAAIKGASGITCNKIILSQGKNYILESSVSVNSKTISGFGAKVTRYKEFFDVNITSELVAGQDVPRGTLTFQVDTSSPDYPKMKVGMGIFISNRKGEARNLESAVRTITKIDGANITCRGNSLEKSFPAGTAAVTNNFPMFVLTYDSAIEGVEIDGGREIYPYDRVYWENSNSIKVHFTNRNVTIRNCIINNSIAEAIITSGRNTLITNNIIKHSGGNGIHLSGCVDCRITNNTIFDSNINPLTNHNEGAISYSNVVKNIFIDNNIFDTCLSGIGSIDSSDNCKSTITNNVFKNFREHGIQARCPITAYGSIFRDYIISGNRFIATQDYYDDWERREEYIYLPSSPQKPANGYGVYFKDQTGSFENVVINNNSFRDCGVYLGNCLIGTINSNVFTYKHAFPIDEAPSHVICLKNSKAIISSNILKVENAIHMESMVLTNGGKSVFALNIYEGIINFISTNSTDFEDINNTSISE